jgi:Tannase and feruloyl esterase
MIGTLTLAVFAATFAATPCEGLKNISLPNTTITTAVFVPEGVYTPPAPPRGANTANANRGAEGRGGGAAQNQGGRGAATPPQPIIAPAHCKVVAVLKPSSDSLINMELWLPPANAWNGKFQAVGNGGWAGSIQGLSAQPGGTPPMVNALRAGYATAGNDTGHEGANGQFTLGHPEKVTDFAYRAMHEMTVQSKALIKTFYDQAPRLSYYNGCSTGGRQGLMSAQRYPEDFDAILAGAPANDHLYLHAGDMARMIDIFKDPEGLIPQAKQTMLAKAVMNACDALDGVTDSLITNPMACKFDPAVLQCKSGDAADCLTSKQVATAKRLYAPAKTAKGELIFPGYAYGGESGYNVMRGAPGPGVDIATNPVPGDLQLGTYRYLAHQDPNWDWKAFNIDTDPALAKKQGGQIDAVATDMSKFKARGGKLLLYHGWADPAIQPEHTVIYYNSVLAKMGKDQSNWLALFMVPGMGHCSGGAGPNQIDWMTTLENWREKGQTPASIIGKGRIGDTPMSRPLCPHPQVATYKGSGDTNDAANFSCK